MNDEPLLAKIELIYYKEDGSIIKHDLGKYKNVELKQVIDRVPGSRRKVYSIILTGNREELMPEEEWEKWIARDSI